MDRKPGRPPTKHRNKRFTSFKVSEDEYNTIYQAWKDSGLPLADFFLATIPFYWKHRKQIKPQEKWTVNIKNKRR
jgi:hypothetical protein